MGGGWNVLFAPGQPVTMSVAAVIAVPWDQTNRKHELALELLTEDGVPVAMEDETIAVTGEFELGRPPGIKPGSSLNAPFVWTFAWFKARMTASTTARPRQSSPMPGPFKIDPSRVTRTSVSSGNTVSR